MRVWMHSIILHGHKSRGYKYKFRMCMLNRRGATHSRIDFIYYVADPETGYACLYNYMVNWCSYYNRSGVIRPLVVAESTGVSMHLANRLIFVQETRKILGALLYAVQYGIQSHIPLKILYVFCVRLCIHGLGYIQLSN